MSKIKWYSHNNYLKELNRIDGMQTEFEWKNFPGFTAVAILKEIQQMIIFMPMFNDIVWDAKGNDELCVNN